jgi:asparaginyl-tRNA synthetase
MATGGFSAAGDGFTASTTGLEHPYTMHGRVVCKKLIAAGKAAIGEKIVVGGWVRTGRKQMKGSIAFLEVTDGSCHATLQVVVPKELYDLGILTKTGCCVMFRGTVVAAPETSSQDIEFKAEEVLHVGPCGW